jgi:hypothetical protein
MITAEELRERLDYDPETGVFTRRISTNFKYKIGDVAGHYNSDGYRCIQIQNREYRAHRLAWLYVHGVWPLAQIDHINGTRDDNRIANLREATRSENGMNKKNHRNKRCALKGVDIHYGRFRARISVQRKTIFLGCYDTEEEAHAAYMAAAEKEFGAFARAE